MAVIISKSLQGLIANETATVTIWNPQLSQDERPGNLASFSNSATAAYNNIILGADLSELGRKSAGNADANSSRKHSKII